MHRHPRANESGGLPRRAAAIRSSAQIPRVNSPPPYLPFLQFHRVRFRSPKNSFILLLGFGPPSLRRSLALNGLNRRHRAAPSFTRRSTTADRPKQRASRAFAGMRPPKDVGACAGHQPCVGSPLMEGFQHIVFCSDVCTSYAHRSRSFVPSFPYPKDRLQIFCGATF